MAVIPPPLLCLSYIWVQTVFSLRTTQIILKKERCTETQHVLTFLKRTGREASSSLVLESMV